MVDFPKAFLGSRRNEMDEVIIDLAEEEEKNDRGTRRVTARCLSHRSGKRERMLISKSSGSNLRPPRLDRSIYAQALDSMCYEQIREIIVKNAPASRPFPLFSLSTPAILLLALERSPSDWIQSRNFVQASKRWEDERSWKNEKRKNEIFPRFRKRKILV